MGAWGEGMRANDTALDAIDGYERELRRIKRKKDQKSLLVLLTEIKAWPCWEWGILGIAEDLIDNGHLALLELSKPIVRTAIATEGRKSRLKCWKEPKARKHALDLLRRRLKGEEVSEVEVDRSNEGLISKMCR